MNFEIDLSRYQPLSFDLEEESPSQEKRDQLLANIALIRDTIVYFTALANTKGLGGHTGGAYDIVPELLIIDGFMKGSERIYPVYFDEAGHRVAAQYMMAVLNGYMEPEALNHYREFDHGLYGHPEMDRQRGIFFSSGRLGHLWSYVNGVAEANPGKKLVMFGSDGSQQEGGDAEAARYAVSRDLDVTLLIDDNDVTIAGHPSQYLPGFDVGKTLKGHGLTVDYGDGEDVAALYGRIRSALLTDGPAALINKRPMAPLIKGIEGSPKGHDVIPVEQAIVYLEERGHERCVAQLKSSSPSKTTIIRKGSSEQTGKNRDSFGSILCELIQTLEQPVEQIMVVDSDLEGSCGLHHIRKSCPEVYVAGGIMERNNFSVAAGFGCEPGRQGVYGTFAAFLEMVVSEITMARLNQANVLAHFSHSGVDDMADNTCHFGINNFFADNGLAEGDQTRLYFPADVPQLRAVLARVFNDGGLRFVFSTRSATPFILDEQGREFYGEGYAFEPGKDEFIRTGQAGYVVSYGEMLYRALDAVERLREAGLDVGLINKPTLNLIDEEALKVYGGSGFVLVAESQNIKSGLGSRLGSWLLERGLTPKFATMGTTREGHGGLGEQVEYQNLETADIMARVRGLI